MSIDLKFCGLLALAVGLWTAVSSAAAEELVLKDGQKIVGTIVGYESDMFRVQTEFGFALVRKDKVARINFAAGGPDDATQKRREGTTVPPINKSGGSNPEKSPGTILVANPETAAKPSPAAVPEKAIPPPKDARRGTPAPAPVEATPPPPPVSRPLDEPLPPHIQEHVEGTNYINDTFGFAMFKPPGWKIYEGVPRETGSGIMAMGTEDEQTLLIVDRQVWSGPPDLNDGRIEAALRRPYQDYQELAESPVQLDGTPAIRRLFRGLLDAVEWHGVSVHVAHGNTVFGIIGLTSAETFQFQQAVFSKIINSFHFLTPTPGSATPQSLAAPERAAKP